MALFNTTDKRDPMILALKKAFAEVNAENRKMYRAGQIDSPAQKRVRLMPRGVRKPHAIADYGLNRKRAYDSYLPMRYAQSFDVYINDDTTANYNLRRERSTGLSAGQLRTLDKALNALSLYELEMHQSLLEKGIHRQYINPTDHETYVSMEKKRDILRAEYPDMAESIVERLC